MGLSILVLRHLRLNKHLSKVIMTPQDDEIRIVNFLYDTVAVVYLLLFVSFLLVVLSFILVLYFFFRVKRGFS